MGKNTSVLLGDRHVEALKKTLEIGEKSGFVKKFDPKQNLKKIQGKFL